MVNRRMIVKAGSMATFFENKNNRLYSDITDDAMSLFHLMRDEIIITKEDSVKIGTLVEFHIDSKGIDQRFNIRHTYTYEVVEYDDISYKMVLIDFKVERIK